MEQKEINNENKLSNHKKNKYPQASAFVMGELCFIVLPFVVMIITFGFKANLLSILYQAEWSFAAAVMFGQSIVKLIHLIGKSASKTGIILHYRVGAVVSIIILLGLVPSLTVLSLILISDVIPIWLIILQLVLFVLSLIVFMVANYGLAEAEEE